MTGQSRTWTILIGFAVSAVFVWLALRGLDIPILVAAVTEANYWYLAACGLILAASIAFRAARWWTIAALPAKSFRHFLRATSLGALSNLLLPARAGEIIRTFTLARWADVALSRSVASTVIDRLLDMLVLAASAVAVCALSPVERLIGHWLLIFVIFVAGITAVLLAFAAVRLDWQQIALRALGRILARWSIGPAAFLNEFRMELVTILRGWRSLELLVSVILVWTADCLAVACALRAFHLRLPLEAPLVLWVFLGAGTMLPSAPGYVGVYQIAIIWALSVYGVSPSIAVALAVSLQAITLLAAALVAGSASPALLLKLIPGKHLPSSGVSKM